MTDRLSKKKIIEIEDSQEVVRLFGHQDEYLRLLETNFSVKIFYRGEKIEISGKDAEDIYHFLMYLLTNIRKHHQLNRQETIEAIHRLKQKKKNGWCL